ncbi:MAG: hypothetical protein R3E39_21720 [Anaerolineae bacterium]
MTKTPAGQAKGLRRLNRRMALKAWWQLEMDDVRGGLALPNSTSRLSAFRHPLTIWMPQIPVSV